MLITLLFTGPGVGLAGVEEEISILRKDMAEVKKDLAEIKGASSERAYERGEAQGPTKTTAEVSLADRPALGRENAPVTMVEFSDYQCPLLPTICHHGVSDHQARLHRYWKSSICVSRLSSFKYSPASPEGARERPLCKGAKQVLGNA